MKRLFLVVRLGAPAARPALADMVVFDDGRVVEAASYNVVEEELEIKVPGAGATGWSQRVERIVSGRSPGLQPVRPGLAAARPEL
jgi:hypothetical protein